VTYSSSCKALPWLVATIPYFYYGTPGTEPGCTYTLQVEPDPGSQTGQVESVDCSGVVQLAVGGTLTFFDDTGCRSCYWEECIVATEPTSWSKVKSLYR
jgi:hypothetical protein